MEGCNLLILAPYKPVAGKVILKCLSLRQGTYDWFIGNSFVVVVFFFFIFLNFKQQEDNLPEFAIVISFSSLLLKITPIDSEMLKLDLQVVELRSVKCILGG